jgi:protein-tyrosine-phosphatase/predicted ATP-grasp superfamily ATP-dependent carboligase
MMETLIIGSNDRAGLTTVRSLGRQGHAITVAAFTKQTVASYSRYVKHIVVITSPHDSLTQSRNDLQALLDTATFNLIVPINDMAIELVMSFENRIPNLALCDFEICQIANNKFRIWQLAQSLDIPVPEGVLLRKQSYRAIIDQNTWETVYCKPVKNIIKFDDRLVETCVKKCVGRDEILDYCNDYIDHCDVLMQKKVAGKGVGVYVMGLNGQVVYQTQQVRLHEPLDGGGSSYRETTDVSPLLAKFTRDIVGVLNWTGPLMVEFKGGDNNYFLMETNGRFWGSLSLTVGSGYDYPAMLPYIFANDAENTKMYLKESSVIRSRHLLKDMKWLFVTSIHYRSLSLLLKFLYDFRYLLTGREVFDVESIADPKPMFFLYIQSLLTFFAFLSEKVEFHFRKFLFLSVGHHKDRMLARLKKSYSIAFVCRGNINRSVFCEYYMKSITGVTSTSIISSFGTIQKEGRLVSERLRRYCLQNLISGIEDFRSRTINADILKCFDIVFALDFKEYYRLIKRFPEYREKIFLLASVLDNVDIIDPHSRPDAVFEKSMNDIKSAVSILHDELLSQNMIAPLLLNGTSST